MPASYCRQVRAGTQYPCHHQEGIPGNFQVPLQSVATALTTVTMTIIQWALEGHPKVITFAPGRRHRVDVFPFQFHHQLPLQDLQSVVATVWRTVPLTITERCRQL